jgi:hypothetical protein
MASMAAPAAVTAAILAIMAVPAHAVPTDPPVVDGTVSGDWGIIVKNGPFCGAAPCPAPGTAGYTVVPAAGSWTYYPATMAAGAFGMFPPPSVYIPPNLPPGGNGNPFYEDTDDSRNNYFVGPIAGGQDYDMEVMAGAMKTGAVGTLADSRIYISVLSGLRPDNGLANFGPGDLRINVGLDTFGIELGGGAGGGAGTVQTDGMAGSHYTLNLGTGHTISEASTVNKIGAMRKNPTWTAGLVAGSKVQMNDGTGTAVDADSTVFGTTLADVVYSADTLCNDGTLAADCSTHGGDSVHSVWEISFDADFLQPYVDAAGNLVFSMAFGPSCANDVAEFLVVLTGASQVPEPTALLGLGAGLAMFGFAVPLYRRRRSA